MVAYDDMQVRVQVVHEHICLGDRVSCGGCLLGSDFIECWQNARVAGATIIQESAADGLDADGAVLIEGGSLRRCCCGLGFS